MSIEAINEQLLRAIGIGVALIDLGDLSLRFRNDTFVEWFGDDDAARLPELFPELDTAALQDAMKDGGRFTTEAGFKLRRRKMSVALEFNRALEQGAQLAVLVCQNITRIKELESMIDSYSMMVERNTLEIKKEKEQVERLLLNLMPRAAYEEYKTFGIVAPRLFDPVSVLAVEFADFNAAQDAHDPGVIVSELNDVFGAFDRIGEQFGCERIRTNGDSYISVSGVPDPAADHATAVANAAVRFVRYLNRRNETHPITWNIRVALTTGRVTGSVVGVQKYIYDVFGPAVRDAMELRRYAEPMAIVADQASADAVGDKFVTVEFETMEGQVLHHLSEAAGD